MPNCAYCGGFTFSTNPICMLCQTKVPYVKYKHLLSTRPVNNQQVELRTTLQRAQKIEKLSDSTLRDKLPEWVGVMVEYLNTRGYWNYATETSPGDQATPSGCEAGTRSLDFQGVRSRNGNYWIDIQAQMGGGGSKRKSYAQVMIQTRLGVDISAEMILAALLSSLNGTDGKGQQMVGVRAVIHDKNAQLP
ncbi:MAG TPA: hypothetical protein VKE74_11255 [Gemmataceae bacterium]|nr:hypothetical protein [Gemmataceae bacterium]